MSELRARPVDAGVFDGVVDLLDGIAAGNAARASLARLGGLEERALSFGDGWAVSVEMDGTTLFVRGEPAGEGARWTICGPPGTKSALHAARRLRDLIGEESPR
jgi:hypothetical protein